MPDDGGGSIQDRWASVAAQPGLRDFWAVYDAKYDEISAAIMIVAAAHPQFGEILARMSADQLENEQRQGREQLRRAIEDGAWQEYEQNLRQQGAIYGRLGVGFEDWYDIVRPYVRQLIPHLVAAYGDDSERLANSLTALQDVTDSAMAIIGSSYIEAKEAVIRAAEQNLATTLDSIGDAVITTDSEGRITRMNPVAEKLTGRQLDDSRGRLLSEVFVIENEETGEPVEDPATIVLRDGVVVGLANHTVLVRPDGTRVPIADSGAPIRAGQGGIEGVVLVFRDMSPERAAARSVRDAFARKAALLESSPDAILSMDNEGRIAEFNPAAERIFGYTRAEVVGRPLAEVIIPERLRKDHVAGLSRYLATGEKKMLGQVHELSAIRADGSEFPAEVSIARVVHDGPPRFSGFIRDITMRKQAEAQLREVKARFDRLSDCGIIGIVHVKLNQDGTSELLEVNPTFADMLGYSVGEVISGQADYRAADWKWADDAAKAQLLETGVAQPYEKEMIRRDGTRVPVLIGTVLVETSQAMAFVLDITERKRLEQARAQSTELEAANRRIQEANRLKSEFLANMSHELRTPLNSIIGFAELLHDGVVGPMEPKQREFIGDILTSGLHLLQLINDVLDLSKVEAGKMEFHAEQVDLERLIHEVVSILRTTAAAGHVTVKASVDPQVRTVECDPARTKQILYNYLSNALKFTSSGGRVWVRGCLEGTDMLRLEVQDTGVGIAEEDIPRLFTEFQQLDSGASKRHSGTGLGLALTKRLAEAQGGAVGVQSVPGFGSTFYATLPLHRPQVDVAVIQQAFPGSPNAPTVLVVEDDERDRAEIIQALLDGGFSVDVAVTGRTAIEMFASRHYDAVTLDLLLPDMSGLDVVSAFRESGHNADVPIIVVTVVTESAAAGLVVNDILSKPLDSEGLLTALSRAGISGEKYGRVLVIDDDAGSVKLMAEALVRLGYEPACFSRAEDALAAVSERPAVAVVLDLLMPGMDGLEFLHRFRENADNRQVPVLVWTVKDLTRDDVKRLTSWAATVLPKAQGSVDLAGALRGHLGTPFPDLAR